MSTTLSCGLASKTFLEAKWSVVVQARPVFLTHEYLISKII